MSKPKQWKKKTKGGYKVKIYETFMAGGVYLHYVGVVEVGYIPYPAWWDEDGHIRPMFAELIRSFRNDYGLKLGEFDLIPKKTKDKQDAGL